MSDLLLSIRELSVAYLAANGKDQTILDRVDLDLDKAKTLALVGESGCGKSTLVKAILRALRAPAFIAGGSVWFNGRDIFNLPMDDLRQLRWRDIAMIVQSAMDALNPVLSLEAQFADTLRAHSLFRSRKEMRNLMIQRLEMAGLGENQLKAYPHEMSGGMRQRAVIAMAMLMNPKLLIMDEPTTALDVVTQGEILGEIGSLQREMGFSIILVTHDLPLALDFTDRIAVMYGGKIVESGPSIEVSRSPRHPYTQGLLDCFPHPGDERQVLKGVPGYPISFNDMPPGCAFQPRCTIAQPGCERRPPPMVTRHDRGWRCANPLPLRSQPKSPPSATG